jgi:ABC-2 type transport system ATP-binding protein
MGMHEQGIPRQGGAAFIWKWGAIFGGILGVIQIIILLLSLGALGTIIDLLIWLVGFFLIGLFAARQTGRVGTGALVGPVTGLIGGLIAVLFGIIQIAANGQEITQEPTVICPTVPSFASQLHKAPGEAYPCRGQGCATQACVVRSSVPPLGTMRKGAFPCLASWGLFSLDALLKGTSMSEPVIQIEHLSRSFGSIKALDDLSLEVPAGIVFGFLGPNGAGKTTTIHLLLGLLEPTKGRASVLGFDTRTQADDIRARSGALLEFHGLYERMSAQDNLNLYGRIYRMPAPARSARIKELLTHLDLWERRRDPVGNWSRGMKQKLAVARALLHHPPLVFLDEPTAGLDPVAAAALREDLASLVAREGVTVFLNTHNLTEAEKLCARVGVIRQGKLVTVGSPDELRARIGGPQAEIVGHGFTEQMLTTLRDRPEVAHADLHNSHVLIELRGESEVGPLVSLLVQAGAEVEEVRRGKASLEDVFLTLMEEEKQ